MIDYFQRRKQLREREEAAAAEGRIPPGQSLTEKWPVLQSGPIPHIDLSTWTFRLTGLVRQPRVLTWQEFSALPSQTFHNDIHCVTRWTKLDNVWEGIPARDVLALVDIAPEAGYLLVHAPDYSANLPLEALQDDDALFAFTHDGRPLTPEHGAPVRLIVPKRYLWKSVKWVTGLEFLERDRPGFWEMRGYHNDGDPFTEERFGV